MKIFVTGNAGYLGTEFAKRYGDMYEIVGYDLTKGENICDYDQLILAMKGCEVVVHLAGIPKPIEGTEFSEYVDINVLGTLNVLRAAVDSGVKKVIYASSVAVYGIVRGMLFPLSITEEQPYASQYLKADALHCREADLSYHISRVMAEQEVAWYGLNKKIQAIVLRFAPVNKVFLGTSVSIENALQAIRLAVDLKSDLWYESFSIVDDLDHISNEKAKRILGYQPEHARYAQEQVRSTLKDRGKMV